jgi:hypothetical protein
MSNKNPLYFCKWKGCKVSGVVARNCDYCNLDNYVCRHTGELCVASKGLEAFAQSLTKSLEDGEPGYLGLFPSATIDPNSHLLSTPYTL